jgi:hypothetical protein
MQTELKVFVVVRRRGDGYHEYQPDLVVAYLDERLAHRHVQLAPDLDVEEVPMAPQAFAPYNFESDREGI